MFFSLDVALVCAGYQKLIKVFLCIISFIDGQLPVVVIFFAPKSILLQLVCQVGEDDITKLRQSAVPFT